MRLRSVAIYVASFALAMLALVPLMYCSIYLLSLFDENPHYKTLTYICAIFLAAAGALLWRWIRVKLESQWGTDV